MGQSDYELQPHGPVVELGHAVSLNQ
jgi:hypothetical protein